MHMGVLLLHVQVLQAMYAVYSGLSHISVYILKLCAQVVDLGFHALCMRTSSSQAPHPQMSHAQGADLHKQEVAAPICLVLGLELGCLIWLYTVAR